MCVARVSLLVLLAGCASKQYEVIMAPEQITPATFVIVEYAKLGGMRVWDCRELPDGETWEPTCVRVRMVSGYSSP